MSKGAEGTKIYSIVRSFNESWFTVGLLPNAAVLLMQAFNCCTNHTTA